MTDERGIMLEVRRWYISMARAPADRRDATRTVPPASGGYTHGGPRRNSSSNLLASEPNSLGWPRGNARLVAARVYLHERVWKGLLLGTGTLRAHAEALP
jgi:hypothetical protein